MSIPALEAALDSQQAISEEISKIHASAAAGETQPRLAFAPYRSAALRHPFRELRIVDPEGAELFAPVFGHADVGAGESDLTITGVGAPIGERIVVRGQVLDGDGRPVRRQLVEIWQANAAGRYVHQRDQHPAPLDPNFTGTGRALTDDAGWYSFITIKPGPYPWHNHHNAWRPAHIHFSLFGSDFTQRMITQMYFPGDPLFPLDPIYQSITSEPARARLVAAYDHESSRHDVLLGYRWDIVLTGGHATPMEAEDA
jgi:protocatechuate 3,4-dioxygenase, beta subunit